MSLTELAYKIKSVESFIFKMYSTIIGLVRILFISKKRNKFPLQNSDTCIVLGNGPSLKDSIGLNRSEVTSKVLFCVNHFAKSDYFLTYKPANYVLLDPAFFDQKENHLVIETFDAIKERTTWELNLFIPYVYKNDADILDIKIKFKNIKVITYNYTILSGFQWINHFFYKQKLAMPRFYNVLGASIFLALNMGFKTIWIFGAEHSWFTEIEVDSHNNVSLKNKHFYDKDKNGEIQFFMDPYTKKRLKLGPYLRYLYLAFDSYYALDNYAKYLGADIYNSSELSFIDAFERKKLVDYIDE